MADLFPYISTDGRLIRLQVEEDGKALAHIDMDAATTSTMIDNLAHLRSRMADKVPATPESLVFRNPARETSFMVGREHAVSRDVLLAFRHPGLGWLAFTLSVKESARLATAIAAQLADIGRASNGLVLPGKPGLIT